MKKFNSFTEKDIKRFESLIELQTRKDAYTIAKINQNTCVKCTKCIEPCPTMAITGSVRKEHFIDENLCIGCGMCALYCPFDCIDMQKTSTCEYDLKEIKSLLEKLRLKLSIADNQKLNNKLYRKKYILDTVT